MNKMTNEEVIKESYDLTNGFLEDLQGTLTRWSDRKAPKSEVLACLMTIASVITYKIAGTVFMVSSDVTADEILDEIALVSKERYHENPWVRKADEAIAKARAEEPSEAK